MLEKTLIDLAHRHFEIMWRYEAMTNSIIVRMENDTSSSGINKITGLRLEKSVIPAALKCL